MLRKAANIFGVLAVRVIASHSVMARIRALIFCRLPIWLKPLEPSTSAHANILTTHHYAMAVITLWINFRAEKAI
jgi:hypothetical protein